MILAGRGFGKTRAGAEWVADLVRKGAGKQRIALVGATIEEARAVMVEGDSGLLNVAKDLIAKWHPSLGELRFKDGSVAKLFSGASPERLRGFQHHSRGALSSPRGKRASRPGTISSSGFGWVSTRE